MKTILLFILTLLNQLRIVFNRDCYYEYEGPVFFSTQAFMGTYTYFFYASEVNFLMRIKWNKFKVPGKMSWCSDEDYVNVSLV